MTTDALDGVAPPASLSQLRAEYMRMSIFLRDLNAQVNGLESKVHELTLAAAIETSRQGALDDIRAQIIDLGAIVGVFDDGR